MKILRTILNKNSFSLKENSQKEKKKTASDDH